jgi:hypothetical protein
VTFKEAVETTHHLENAWKPGLQALRAEDRPHIEPEDTRRLTGSADIDTALVKICSHANRWDFGIGYQHTDRKDEMIYWTELHTASDSQVKVVIAKVQWLLAWLKGQGKCPATFERDIVWVSSGATTFTLTSPQKKAMAAAGLRHVGLKLRIRKRRE